MMRTSRHFWLLTAMVAALALLQILAAAAEGAECEPLGCGPRPWEAAHAGRLQQATEGAQNQLQQSTIRIVSEGSGEASSVSGSLVAIDDSRGDRRGLILTCAHGLRDGWPSFVLFSDGKRLPAELLGSDAGADLAAFEVAGVPRPSWCMAIAEQPLGPGEVARWEGFAGVTPYVRSDRVASVDPFRVRVPGQSPNGTSGGPIYGESGLQSVVSQVDNRTGRWEVSGPCLPRIRQFLGRLKLRIDGTDFRRGDETDQLVPIVPAPGSGQNQSPPDAAKLAASPELADAIVTALGRSPDVLGALAQRIPTPVIPDPEIDKLRVDVGAATSSIAGLKQRIDAAKALGDQDVRSIAREVAVGIVKDRAPGLLPAVLPGLLAALGWTGPPAAAAMVGLGLLRLLLRRSMQRLAERREGAATSPPIALTPPQSSPAPDPAVLAECRRRGEALRARITELENQLAGARVEGEDVAALRDQLAALARRRDELAARCMELERRQQEFVIGETDLHRRATELADASLHQKDPVRWAQFLPQWRAMVDQYYTALRQETRDAGSPTVHQ